jgi:hypothetical protein
MVYIGYPVCMEEALRLCNLTTSYNQSDYYNYHKDVNSKLENYLKPYGLNFYGLDKGVYVIGIEVDNYLSNMNVNMDDFMITLITLKNKVKNGIFRASIDLSNVEIETDLEAESIVVQNPEPYFINYGYN